MNTPQFDERIWCALLPPPPAGPVTFQKRCATLAIIVPKHDHTTPFQLKQGPAPHSLLCTCAPSNPVCTVAAPWHSAEMELPSLHSSSQNEGCATDLLPKPATNGMHHHHSIAYKHPNRTPEVPLVRLHFPAFVPPPPPPLVDDLSAGACTARQCPVASEMACQPWGIPRGRGVQTQAQAMVACPPLSFLSTSRSATRRNIPYSQARRPAIRRCDCPSSSTLHVSRRSGGAPVPPPTPMHVSRRSGGATPHPNSAPPVLAPYTWAGASRRAHHTCQRAAPPSELGS